MWTGRLCCGRAYRHRDERGFSHVTDHLTSIIDFDGCHYAHSLSLLFTRACCSSHIYCSEGIGNQSDSL